MTALRVLLVDDEKDFLRLLATRLRRRALEVYTAVTAESALELLASREVDVVVLDIRLPGMDGLEAMERIRQDHPAVQVVMLTGYADTEMARRALEQGASAYLVKPVDVGTLLDRIHRALDERPAPPTQKIHDSS